MKNSRYGSISRAMLCAISAAILMAATFSAATHAATPVDPSPTFTQGEPEMLPATLVSLTVMTKGLHESNGTNVHPAIVTRDWSHGADITKQDKTLVNLTVIGDTEHHIIPRTSVTLYETEAIGDAATAKMTPEGRAPRPYFAYLAPVAKTDSDMSSLLHPATVDNPAIAQVEPAYRHPVDDGSASA